MAVLPHRHLRVAGDRRDRVIELDRDILHVGRGLGADVRFDDAAISRRHAVLVVRPDAVRLLDDHSLAGTLVNGRRVRAATLSDGDVIALGSVVLTFVDAPALSAVA